MPRKQEIVKQIREERLNSHRCYDCGKKLWFYIFNKRTRCHRCFRLERIREKRRKRDRSKLGKVKRFFYYCCKHNQDGNKFLEEK